MRLVVRAILVWLMVLALPVQGFAVAAMLHCGPAQVPIQAPVPMQATAPGVNAPAGHEHHHPAGAAAPGEPADAHLHHAATGHSSAGDPTTAGHHCSVCAACCVALALPASAAKLLPVLHEPGFSRGALPARVSFVPAGLDRPPRPILA